MILLTFILALQAWLRPLAHGLVLCLRLGACDWTRPDAEHRTTSKPSERQAHETPCPKPAAVDHARTLSGDVARESGSQRPANPTQRGGTIREFDTHPGRDKCLLTKQSLVVLHVSSSSLACRLFSTVATVDAAVTSGACH